MRSVEHVKRYTTIGSGSDQGRTSNVNAAAILAALTGTDPSGLSGFRSPATPVSFAAYAGRDVGHLADLVRTQRRDVTFLDAPVFGSREPAERGELTIFASGPQGLTSLDTSGQAIVPEDIIWIDLLEPTVEEEKSVESLLAVDVPTREEMKEIETSNRLYEDNGALYMTATVAARLDTARCSRNPV